MLCHDFSAPTPPGTLRISVLADGERYVLDLPAAKLDQTLRAFADFAGLDAGSGDCKAVAAEAAENGDAYMVAVAALWLFLRQPGAEYVMDRERLTSILNAGDAALLAVTVDDRPGGDWRFMLYEKPHRPAFVAPYKTTARERRRRWR
jgi:hypothetical protein